MLKIALLTDRSSFNSDPHSVKNKKKNNSTHISDVMLLLIAEYRA